MAETFATTCSSLRQRRTAWLACGMMSIISAVMIPWAAQPLPPMPGFLAVSQTALILVYGVITWLFYSQYRRSPCTSLLALAAGSLFTTAIVLIQLVCFPDMFSKGLLLGQGPPTLTWLWNLWHISPPLMVLIYALTERAHPAPLKHPRSTGALVMSTTLVLACATAALTIWGAGALPHITEVDGGYRGLTTSGIGPALIILNVAAILAVTWICRMRSVLQLGLGTALILLLFDNGVTDLAAMRGTVGWVAGRIEALLAGFAVLAVYLNAFDFLYAQAEAAAVRMAEDRAAIAVARDRLDLALDAAGMAEWSLDLATRAFDHSHRFDTILGGLKPGWTWDWQTFLTRIMPSDRPLVEAAFAEASTAGSIAFECQLIPKDGGSRFIAMHGRLRGHEGEALRLNGVLMDITARRELEDRLRHTQKMEAIGQLTGGVAHDFNNLLTVILGGLDIIARDPASPQAARMTRVASQAARRGRELTEKLLSFSRRQLIQPETVNANHLLHEFLPLVARAVGETVKVELDPDPTLDPVRLDPNEFQAAILNLAANARDAMPSGGLLRIETRNHQPTAEDLTDLPDLPSRSCLRVTVADTGSGMDKATAARVFEPFFTTKEVGKGTGLGLSQVYGFVRQAGGQCRIRTAPGAGFALDMFLPRPTSSAAPVPSVETGSNMMPLRQTSDHEVVLVVEDDEAVREIAANSLQALGYRVIQASEARGALDILRGPTRIDVLFSDVVMPGGMNGAQLAEEARRLRPEMRILLTSGYTLTATGGTAKLPPDIPLLRKPYVTQDLAAKLQTVLGEQRAQ